MELLKTFDDRYDQRLKEITEERTPFIEYARLKAKLGPESQDIQSVKGLGYRLNPTRL